MPQDNYIQRGELIQRLVKGLEIKGVGSPTLQLDNVVSPMVLLEDLTRQSPFRQVVERRAGCFQSEPALAGELSGVALVNPATSGIIAIVDWAHATDIQAGGTTFLCGLTGSNIPATYTQLPNLGGWYDHRNAAPPNFQNIALQVWSGTNAVSLIGAQFALWHIRISAASGWISSPEQTRGVVILPGDNFIVENQTANHPAEVSLSWIEYSASAAGF